jgi:hypothetical protein
MVHKMERRERPYESGGVPLLGLILYPQKELN